jgi:hypothetical protein
MSQNRGNRQTRYEKDRILFEQNDMVKEDIDKKIGQTLGNKLSLSYSVKQPNVVKVPDRRL